MKHSRLVDVSGLKAALQNFADERDWNRFHSPKNLAMALTGEVGELVELFQWLTEDESNRVGQDSATSKLLLARTTVPPASPSVASLFVLFVNSFQA